MKKLLLSVAVGSVLGLTGCLADGEDAPVSQEQAGVPYVRVAFDPAAGDISVPSNFLYLGTQDGTLDVPNEGPDDPANALDALDGWSTTFPAVFSFNYPTGQYGSRSVTVDASTAEAAGAVRVFKVIEGGNAVNEQCAALQPVVACAVQSELEFGTDFVTSFNSVSGALSVVPLRPLEPEASYMIALTDGIEDDRGRAVRPSQTYFAASQDDIELEGQGAQVQAIVRQNHAVLDGAGVNPENVIYTSLYTTQSIDTVLQVVQSYLASDLAALGAGQPTLTSAIQTNFAGVTVAQALSQNVEGFPATQPAPGEPFFFEYAVSNTAELHAGNFELPYFSGLPTAENQTAPLSERWEAEFVSPATVGLALSEGRISAENLIGCGMPQATVGEFGATEDPSVFLGELAYADLPATDACAVLDDGRHLTKYNPLPLVRASVEVPLWMSVPVEAQVNGVRATLGLPAISEPADGWPVVIFQHGITGNKEQFLAIAGALSVSGHAAIAIDHPLHGERGFGAINASAEYTDADGDPAQGDPTAYLNLGSLLTARDNVRQSTADLLSLRFALSRPDSTFGGAQIDRNTVKFVGHSLGGIAGVNMTAIANTPFPQMPEGFALGDYFGIDQAVFAMAGGGIAPFLIDSESFGPLIREQLAAQAGGLQGAELEALIQQFTFAAQTVIDSADPLNFAGHLVETETPRLLIQANDDAVIPNQASVPLSGTEPLAVVLGLDEVTETVMGEEPQSGFIKVEGASHGSLLQQGEDDEEGTTQAIQLMIATWLESQGTVINLDNEE
ncbi:hypothetical protein CWE12_04535 [Aliidiomarina sedimenti]|uniref:Bacterial virulence factor lipase N-terminal domain-containing protein n=1 Tax=Aliidiomarina sedimenti TaxID=1933879 RepID=A0ABY0C2Z9_9GAMM|nr:VolA/Pla-1 family phospholipase [Aliidiomarina sedimenti]RUO32247.1 hypothetical protein CWE12_04535 [Aliidiomarina sedimenti]